MARSRFALAAAMAATVAACGGSSGNGTVAVHLVDAPADYKEINLNITGVELHGDSVGWVNLGRPDPALMPVDLLTLTGGVAATLVPKTAVPADTYSQMRLHLGPGNTVVLQDGSVHDLTVPSGLQSGLKLVIKLHVAAGADKDVFIDFDAKNSIHLHATGASGKYILRPVIFATERATAGAIAGKLTTLAGEATQPAPLPGVEVMAEAFDGAGNPVVVAATKTLADGSYKLEHLPFGTYHVVSQPVVGPVAYAAQASGPIAVDETHLLGSWSATFAPAGAVGGIGGKITPTATDLQADALAVRQLLGPAGSARPFIVRRGTGVVAATGESYAFELLPVGPYEVVATRRTFDATGAVVGVAVKGPLPAAVAAGAGTAVDVAF